MLKVRGFAHRVVLAVLAVLAVLPAASVAQVFPANDHSFAPTISADGTKLAFFSSASNLVPADTNGVEDVFVLDRGTNTVTRASTNSRGQESNGQSFASAIDSTGRWVVFVSNASNLVPGDTNGEQDVFRKDLQDGSIVRVSTASDGSQLFPFSPGSRLSSARVSPGGRFVTYYGCLMSFDLGLGGCRPYLKDLQTGAVYSPQGSVPISGLFGVASVGSRASVSPVGVEAFLTFGTTDTLVPADTNGAFDVYLGRLVIPDAPSGTPAFQYTLVSRNTGGTNGGNAQSGAASGESELPPGISGDGERISYFTAATDVAPVPCNGAGMKAIVFDVSEGTNTCESGVLAPVDSFYEAVNLSPDGNHVIYFARSGFTWFAEQVRNGVLAPINLGTGGHLGSRLELLARGTLSNGATVGGYSQAGSDPGSVRNDTRYDIVLSVAGGGGGRTLSLASTGRVGTSQDGHSRVGSISATGRHVAFSSRASGFGGADPGGDHDVYLRDLDTGTLTRVSAPLAAPKSEARWPDVSSNGTSIVFVTTPISVSCPQGARRVYLWTAPSTVQCLDGVPPAGATTLNGVDIQQPSISDDGTTVAFVAQPNTGGVRLYRKTLPNAVPSEVAANQGFEPLTFQLSATGRYIAYGEVDPAAPFVSGLPGCDSRFRVKRFDATANTTVEISRFNGTTTSGSGAWASISPDGAHVAFVSCDNLANEPSPPPGTKVFLWSAATGSVARLEAGSVGRPQATVKARTRVAAFGRYVTYVADDVCVTRCGSRNRSVYLYDALERSLRTISATTAKNRANGPSGVADNHQYETSLYSLDIDGAGRRVVFGSAATNLSPRDLNAADDVFVVDVPSQTIGRVSAFGSGIAGDFDRVKPSLSGSGAVVAYGKKDRDGALNGAPARGGPGAPQSKGVVGNKFADIAVYVAGGGGETVITTDAGAPADGDSDEPDVSPDGSVIAFSSDATNLGPAPDTNSVTDIMVYEMQTASNVSVTGNANGPSAAPAASSIGDKFVVAFTTDATNLQTVAPTADTNGVSDVVVATEGTGAELVSRADGVNGQAGNGPSGEAAILPGGTMVAFSTLATNLRPGTADTNGVSDIVLRDLVADVNIAISDPDGAGPVEADGPSSSPSIGRPTSGGEPYLAAFESDATNLRGPNTDLNANTDVYLKFGSGPIRIVSHALGDPTVPANGTSSSPRISPDALTVSFVSNASDLITGDDNGVPDLFAYDVQTQVITRISEGVAQADGNDLALAGDVGTGSDGRIVAAFDSAATNLTPTLDTEEAFDIYYLQGTSDAFEIGDPDGVFKNGFE